MVITPCWLITVQWAFGHGIEFLQDRLTGPLTTKTGPDGPYSISHFPLSLQPHNLNYTKYKNLVGYGWRQSAISANQQHQSVAGVVSTEFFAGKFP